MKNITVSVDNDVYNVARIEAAKRGTSVSALVRNFLAGLSSDTSRDPDGEARNRLMQSLQRRTAHFRMGPTPTRDEMNER